jgi:hypothetical protein
MNSCGPPPSMFVLPTTSAANSSGTSTQSAVRISTSARIWTIAESSSTVTSASTADSE